MLERSEETGTVIEVRLTHAEDPLMPAAMAKAFTALQSHLERRVAALIDNESFYANLYVSGFFAETALNLHGMFLLCSNPENNANMILQTWAQYQGHDRNSGLYINVGIPHVPRLECKEGAETRLSYIDKLWSLFRDVVMRALETKLVEKLLANSAFLQETDPETRRDMAGVALDGCAFEVFGGAAGNPTGITRHLLINAAIEQALEPQAPPDVDMADAAAES